MHCCISLFFYNEISLLVSPYFFIMKFLCYRRGGRQFAVPHNSCALCVCLLFTFHLFIVIDLSFVVLSAQQFLSPMPSPSISSPLVLHYCITPLKSSLFGCGGGCHLWWLDWGCHHYRLQYRFVWLRSLGLLGCVVMSLSKFWHWLCIVVPRPPPP